MRLQFCCQSVEIWLKIQTCWTNFWWVMRHISICMVQLISRTFDTGQLQVLTNFINAPLMTQKLLYGALFGLEESMDHTSLRMKVENPSQLHCNVTQRWSMNFCPRIFHQTTVPCGFNKMVPWPTRQWLASLRIAVCFRSEWFLGAVPRPPRLSVLTAPDFFLWGYLKSKMYSTRPTYLHALKENIWEEIAKLSEEKLQAVMRTFVTCVHLCIEEGGGHLKDIVHNKWNYVKSTIVNCEVPKLVSITFSKMLFLFIINSLFLQQPVISLKVLYLIRLKKEKE